MPLNEEQREVVGMLRQITASPNEILILDTETTGLKDFDVIVEVAVINLDGDCLYQTFVEPTVPISAKAWAIHGISDEVVIGKPKFADIYEVLANLLRGKTVITFNADFDCRMLMQSVHNAPFTTIDSEKALFFMREVKWVCLMREFARFYGEWNSFRGGFQSKSLDFAMRYLNVPELPGAHRAVADCQRALGVLRALLAKGEGRAMAAPLFNAVRFATRVRAHRGEMDLREAASASRVSASTISRVEHRKIPDMALFLSLCDWMHASPCEFFTIIDTTPPRPGIEALEAIEIALRQDGVIADDMVEAIMGVLRLIHKEVERGERALPTRE